MEWIFWLPIKVAVIYSWVQMFPHWHAANNEDFGDIRKCIMMFPSGNVNFVQIFVPNTPLYLRVFDVFGKYTKCIDPKICDLFMSLKWISRERPPADHLYILIICLVPSKRYCRQVIPHTVRLETLLASFKICCHQTKAWTVRKLPFFPQKILGQSQNFTPTIKLWI